MNDRQPCYRRELSPFWRMARLWAALVVGGVILIALGVATRHPAGAWFGGAILAAGIVVAGLAHRIGRK